MCLIAFAIGARADLPLVVASNRDEHWARPTQPLQAWALPSGKTAYSGQDLRAGGTWLGLAQDGRVAMLTNVRNGRPDDAPRSRGELVTGWLDAACGWEEWLQRFDPAQYGGFNLVLGELARGRWAWVSNRSPDPPDLADDARAVCLPPGWHGRGLASGLYGLSNAALDTPWPKTVALKQALQQHLDEGARPQASDRLLAALLHMTAVRDEQLPATGVALEVERRLSSPFVHAPEMDYGTRSSLLAHACSDGRLLLQEWTHDPAHPHAAAHGSGCWPLQGSRLRQMAIDCPLGLQA